jgi:hypothetical protein
MSGARRVLPAPVSCLGSLGGLLELDPQAPTVIASVIAASAAVVLLVISSPCPDGITDSRFADFPHPEAAPHAAQWRAPVRRGATIEVENLIAQFG